MNTTVVISLDTRRAKNDGTYPLILRLSHNGQTTSIPLKESIGEEYWDKKKRTIKKTYKGKDDTTRFTNRLEKERQNAWDMILELHKSGVLKNLSITSLKELLVLKDEPAPKETKNSFFQFASRCVDDLVKAHRIGTARSYKGIINVLKDYLNGKDLSFTEITYDFLDEFETHHKSKGNGLNGLSVYVRAIRAIYNKAIRSGLVEKERYPFGAYKIKSAPTEKRALDGELLKKIIELDLSANDLCFNTRNYFLASYMMYGMNFADMAYLQKSSIENGRVRYRRRKTGKLYDIKITPQLETILNHYIQQNPDSKFIFPILKRDSSVLRENDIQWARNRYNKKLKLLASRCGIDSKLTSYVSRHSFATQAMLHDVPLTAISTMLGHSSLKTTEVYLKGLPINILDNYNERILEA